MTQHRWNLLSAAEAAIRALVDIQTPDNCRHPNDRGMDACEIQEITIDLINAVDQAKASNVQRRADLSGALWAIKK